MRTYLLCMKKGWGSVDKKRTIIIMIMISLILHPWYVWQKKWPKSLDFRLRKKQKEFKIAERQNTAS